MRFIQQCEMIAGNGVDLHAANGAAQPPRREIFGAWRLLAAREEGDTTRVGPVDIAVRGLAMGHCDVTMRAS